MLHVILYNKHPQFLSYYIKSNPFDHYTTLTDYSIRVLLFLDGKYKYMLVIINFNTHNSTIIFLSFDPVTLIKISTFVKRQRNLSTSESGLIPCYYHYCY